MKVPSLRELASQIPGNLGNVPSAAESYRLTQEHPTPDKLLSVKETASRLGMSPTTIHARISAGHFHPLKIRGKLYITTTEVEEEARRLDNERSLHAYEERRKTLINQVVTPPRAPLKRGPKPKSLSTADRKNSTTTSEIAIYTGEQAADSALLFRAGKTQLDVVIEMKVSYELAEHFWNRYQQAQPSWLIPSKTLTHFRMLYDWDEEPPSPEGFQKAVRAYIERETSREAARNRKSEPEGNALSEEEKAVLAEVDAEIGQKARKKE
jgi:hypothetical protein